MSCLGASLVEGLFGVAAAPFGFCGEGQRRGEVHELMELTPEPFGGILEGMCACEVVGCGQVV